MTGRFDGLSISQLVALLQTEEFSSEWRDAAANAGATASRSELQQLAGLLTSEDRRMRRNVATVMAETGNPYAIRLLVENVLEYQDEEVVKVVIPTLMPMREAAVDLLHTIMVSSTGLTRVRASLILGQIGNSDGIDALIESIDHIEDLGDEDILPQILEALGTLRDARGVEPLAEFLIGEDWLLRLVAQKSLVQIGEPSIDALLAVAQDSRDGDARCRAVEALGQIGSAKAVAPLVELLRGNAGHVRMEIIDTLGRIGDPASVEALVEALSTEENSGHFRASKALVSIGSPAVKEFGRLVLEHPKPEVRRSATAALGQIGDRDAVPLVIKALQDQNSLVRRAATDALGNLKDRRAVEPLCQALEHENWFVVGGAADALAKIGDTRAVGPLLDVLRDERSEVRQKIARALQRFGPDLDELAAGSQANAVPASIEPSEQGSLSEEQIVETLVEALDDDNTLTRISIADVLVCMKGDHVAQRLSTIVQNGGQGAEEIRSALVKAERSI